MNLHAWLDDVEDAGLDTVLHVRDRAQAREAQRQLLSLSGGMRWGGYGVVTGSGVVIEVVYEPQHRRFYG